MIHSMRITGGKARGITLTTGKARQVRPAMDRVREAVFSSLGERIHGAYFLDLFAGAGCYGLEALSRGASRGLFVEKQATAAMAIQKNLEAVGKSIGGLPDRSVSIIRRDVLKFSTNDRFNIIFMDPPYELARSHGRILLDKAGEFLDRASPSLLVFELPADLSLTGTAWTCLRRIGKSGTNEPCVLILEPSDQ